ncbi:MAG: TIGR01212 family radical SAM protein [Lachnospiraceae bacterium]|nr:TIGR01212 family radical SAM protein [Lachnospiraceae bacterium]
MDEKDREIPGPLKKEMISFNDYCRKIFGEKIYKISLNAGFSCPNRDGTKGSRGCIFCSEGGSGDFAQSLCISVSEQIEQAKQQVADKYQGTRYIAYFQAFTNTYGEPKRLREIFLPIAERDDIVAIDIATRPDCLGEEVLEVLKEIKEKKPVIVELGLQTIHEKTINYIRRAYENREYEEAVVKLNDLEIHIVTHVILGLPGETKEDMVETVKYVVQHKSSGIKLQLLHVLKGTDLAVDYEAGMFEVLSLDAYMDILKACVAEIPEEMVVHRLTGDGPKKLLVAPLWSGDKKRVLNRINKEIWKK